MQAELFTSISLSLLSTRGKSQRVSMIRDPTLTSHIRWARALKPLRDRRRLLEKTRDKLTVVEQKALHIFQGGEAAFNKLWPKLRRAGFTSFDTIPHQATKATSTSCCCPILGSAEAVHSLLLNDWLHTLTTIEGHVASLEIPTSPFSFR